MVSVKCKCCGKEFQARKADIKRGWGKFCSKSCKAIRQVSRGSSNGNGRLMPWQKSRHGGRMSSEEFVHLKRNPNVISYDEDTGEEEFFANFSNELGGDY